MVLWDVARIGMYTKTLTIIGLIALGVLGRLVPHLPNATPLTAITVSASRYVGRSSALVIPIAVMLASDMVLGFYNWKILLSVYGSFIVIGLVSIAGRKYRGIFPTGVLVISSSLLFFLITNFAVWFFSPWYEKSIWGLLYCYQLGIPFLRNMMLGDVAYTACVIQILGLLPAETGSSSQLRRYVVTGRTNLTTSSSLT